MIKETLSPVQNKGALMSQEEKTSYKCNDRKDKICQYKVKLLSKMDL